MTEEINDFIYKGSVTMFCCTKKPPPHLILIQNKIPYPTRQFLKIVSVNCSTYRFPKFLPKTDFHTSQQSVNICIGKIISITEYQRPIETQLLSLIKL